MRAHIGSGGPGAPGTVTFSSSDLTGDGHGHRKHWSPRPPVHWCKAAGSRGCSCGPGRGGGQQSSGLCRLPAVFAGVEAPLRQADSRAGAAVEHQAGVAVAQGSSRTVLLRNEPDPGAPKLR
ncbi:unnamed protein product [Coccothraustes coccothraustes]